MITMSSAKGNIFVCCKLSLTMIFTLFEIYISIIYSI